MKKYFLKDNKKSIKLRNMKTNILQYLLFAPLTTPKKIFIYVGGDM